MRNPPLSNRHSITREQIRIIKQLDYHIPLYAILQITLYLGLRPKEALALSWNKVHLSSKSVRVCRQLFYNKRSNKFELRPFTKTFRPRTLTLGPDAVQVLLAMRERQKLMKGNNALKLVFTHDNGLPFTEDEVNKEFLRLMADTTNPDVRFYDLRHTAATAAHLETNDVISVQNMMGHTRPEVTKNYYLDHDNRGKRITASKVNSYTEGVIKNE